MVQELHSDSPSTIFLATGVRPQADTTLQPRVVDSPDALVVETAVARYTFGKRDGRLTVMDMQSQRNWSLVSLPCAVDGVNRKGNTWTLAPAAGCAGPTLALTLLTAKLARLDMHAPSTAKELALTVSGDGPYFGLGERFYQAGLKNQQLDLRPQDRYGEPGHNWTYMGIPLLYSTGGLGLFADTAFDTRAAVDETGGSAQLRLAHDTASIYLFAEQTPKGVLTAYTALTGRPQMPPLWEFGPWITSLQGKGPVLDYAHRLRVDGIPASALWIFDEQDEADNLGWPFWFSSYYGDARTMNDTLHGMGFRVLTYVHPYIREQVLPYPHTDALWNVGVEKKYLMTNAEGQPAGPRFEEVKTGNVDFTNPAAVNWWQTMITHAVRDQDFDGWMEDFGEWVRDTDHFQAAGGTVMSELYPLFYHKVTSRIAQGLKPDLVSFSRSAAPGTQALSPAMWGADQSGNWSRDFGFPSVVTAGITAGMSGFSNWGPDIMSAGDSRDLWMRWVEFGALSPIMRDHVWNRPNGTFNIWTDSDTSAHFRRYAVLHSSMLPIFATYADEAHRTGVPIMRHPALEFPNDARSVATEYEYMIGSQILVAPVVAPASTRLFYLPPGEWINYWTGDSLTGGQDNTVNSGSDNIPLLIKAGSILPFKPEAEAARWDWNDPHLLDTSLVWQGFLSETGEGHGDFAMPNGTSATLTEHGEHVTITGASRTQRDYEIIIRSRRLPTDVKLNGASFAPFSAGRNGARASQWWWNPGSSEVHLLFHAATFHVDLDGMVASQYANR